MHFIPTVILKKNSKEYAYDIFSRLLEDRIIMLCGEINDEMASSIVSQLLYLESLDQQADIDMYIHSRLSKLSLHFFRTFIQLQYQKY